MISVPLEGSAPFGKWTWNLRYSHSALRHIQMITASLTTFSEQLLAGHRSGDITTGLDARTAVILIWAGQSWAEPKLTPAKVEKRLWTMSEGEQKLLMTWAGADFLTACLTILSAQVTADVTAHAIEDDDE